MSIWLKETSKGISMKNDEHALIISIFQAYIYVMCVNENCSTNVVVLLMPTTNHHVDTCNNIPSNDRTVDHIWPCVCNYSMNIARLNNSQAVGSEYPNPHRTITLIHCAYFRQCTLP